MGLLELPPLAGCPRATEAGHVPPCDLCPPCMDAGEWLRMQEEAAPFVVPLELPEGDGPEARAREAARFFDALLRAGDPFHATGMCTLVVEESREEPSVCRALAELLGGCGFRVSLGEAPARGGSRRPAVRVHRPLRGRTS